MSAISQDAPGPNSRALGQSWSRSTHDHRGAFQPDRFLLAVRRPLAISSQAAVLLGALAFGFLKRGPTKPWKPTYRTRLALFGTMVSGALAGTLLLLIKYVYAPRARLPGRLLFIGFVLFCLLYFVVTMFGLWVGSRQRESAESHKATVT